MAAEEGVVSACHTKEEFHSQMDKTKEAKKLDVAEEYNVQGMPTFHFVKGGEKIDIVVGAKKDELRPSYKKYLDAAFRKWA
nr:unnamed protein product [Digitaria exilis]